MSDSIIEKSIPIPPKSRQLIQERFPELLCLEVGNSFMIPKDQARFPLHISIAMFGIKNDQRHEVRELDNGDFRVWRVF